MLMKFLTPAMVLLAGMMASVHAGQVEMNRFFHCGDGRLHMVSEKNGHSFSGRFRIGPGHYNLHAYQQMSAVFGAPIEPQRQVLSLRLIEFLDYLEDRLAQGALLTITSGYRAPEYNAKLRKGGALAAKASLHQYGRAADFKLEGVPSKRVWEYVRGLKFGGTGYYHGETVHVDVGPARFWDEKSSGVGSGLSDDNKLIGMVTGYDIFSPGERLALSFIRMTAFPIYVQREFLLIDDQDSDQAGSGLPFEPDLKSSKTRDCLEFGNISQMASLGWALPSQLVPGRYRIRARFCGKLWPQMPTEIFTPVFEVRSP